MKFARTMFVINCVLVALWAVMGLVYLNIKSAAAAGNWAIAFMFGGAAGILVLGSLVSIIVSAIALEKNSKTEFKKVQNKLGIVTVILGLVIAFVWIKGNI